MALPIASKLIEQAELAKTDSSIKPLTTKERRHVLNYLEHTEHKSNTELAEMLGVSIRMITTDKQVIRKENASQIKDIDISLVINDFQICGSRQINDLERSKAKLQPGTAEYRKTCESIVKVSAEVIGVLQNLGWYPKQIGNMTIQNFNYESSMEGGATPTNKMVIDADLKQLPEGSEDGAATQDKVN